MTYATLFPAGTAHAPVVYFLQLGNRVKIGTSTNLATRVRSLSLGMEDVRCVMLGGVKLERTVHKRYAEYRVHINREWFEVRGGLQELLEAAVALQGVNLKPVILKPDGQMLVDSEAIDSFKDYALKVKEGKVGPSAEELAAAIHEYHVLTEAAKAAAAKAESTAMVRARTAARLAEVYKSQYKAAARLGMDQSTLNKLVKKARADGWVEQG